MIKKITLVTVVIVAVAALYSLNQRSFSTARETVNDKMLLSGDESNIQESSANHVATLAPTSGKEADFDKTVLSGALSGSGVTHPNLNVAQSSNTSIPDTKILTDDAGNAGVAPHAN